MILNQFLLGDITEDPGSGFVVHTKFPRFILTRENYEVQLLEQVDINNMEIKSRIELLINQATDFYNQALIIKD